MRRFPAAPDVGPSRTTRLLEILARQPGGELPTRVCGAATEVLHARGVGLSLASDGTLTLAGVTEGARMGERLQADLGEGPCYVAHRTGAAVAVPVLAAETRWPVFAPATVEDGIGAVFAFPLQRGAIHLGAMTVYRRPPGELTDAEHADALALARLGTDLLLALQAELPAGELPPMVTDQSANAWVVHQACGMLAVQLRVPVEDALARLRAHAYATGRAMDVVAADVLARDLRLDGP